MVDLRDHPRWVTSEVAAPVAGANLVFTVPSGNILTPLIGVFSLTTSAAVANRVVTLEVTDGVNVWARFTAPISQAASLTRNYTVVPDGGVSSPPGSVIPIPYGVRYAPLEPGFVIQTAIDNLQAADQVSAIRFRALAWPTGPRVAPIIAADAMLEPRGDIPETVPVYYSP